MRLQELANAALGYQPEIHLRLGSGVTGDVRLSQIDQALTWRAEHIDLVAVAVRRPGAMRHPRRNYRDVALAHRAHVSIEVKNQLTFDDDHDLLFLVHVPRSHRAGREPDEIRQRPVAEHRAEPEAGRELN